MWPVSYTHLDVYKRQDEFFQAHPKAVLGIVFNSRVYQLGEYLRHAEHSMKGLIGYDLLKANGLIERNQVKLIRNKKQDVLLNQSLGKLNAAHTGLRCHS